MPDSIQIEGLRLPTRIGVPDAERAAWQSVAAHLTLVPEKDFHGIEDDITATVDYDAVSREIRALAADRPRKLLETLANEIASTILSNFPVRSVTVELRKFILPDCDHVAVEVTRP